MKHYGEVGGEGVTVSQGGGCNSLSIPDLGTVDRHPNKIGNNLFGVSRRGPVRPSMQPANTDGHGSLSVRIHVKVRQGRGKAVPRREDCAHSHQQECVYHHHGLPVSSCLCSSYIMGLMQCPDSVVYYTHGCRDRVVRGGDMTPLCRRPPQQPTSCSQVQQCGDRGTLPALPGGCCVVGRLQTKTHVPFSQAGLALDLTGAYTPVGGVPAPRGRDASRAAP
jgi:hypothetical protein